MSDEELRALEREATEGDPTASLRLAQALARAGRGDDAGHAIQRAFARGGDATEALDALAPRDLESFQARELGTRFELGKLWFTAWSPDARTIYAIENKKSVLGIDAATGARATVATLSGEATAFAADLEGKRLALGLVVPEGRKLVNQLAVLDLANGALTPVGRGHQWIHATALTHEAIFAVEKHRVRGYRLEAPEKPAVSVQGSGAVSPNGTILAVEENELTLRSPLEKTVRVSMPLDVTPATLARFHIAHAVARALIVAEDVVLLDATGAVVSRTKLPSPDVYDVLPAPSGRHLAVTYLAQNERTTRLDLLDLTTAKSRTFDLGARPRQAAWSPSGQRLAVPTDQGTIVLLEAAAAPPPARPEKSKDDWIELRSPSRFWRGRQTGALVEFHHGPLGTRGTRGATPCDSPESAARELERRIREKRADGYGPPP